MSQPTTTTTTLFGDVKFYLTKIEAAADADGLLDRPSESNAMVTSGRRLVAGLDAMVQARANIESIMTNGRYSLPERIRQRDASMAGAFKTADDATDAFESTMASSRRGLEKRLLPKVPKDASEAAVFDRKEDISALVRNYAGPPSSRVASVAKLLRDALESGDALTSYVVAGGPMTFVYQGVGLSAEALQQAFAEVIGQVTNPDGGKPAKGAAMLALLQSAGVGTPAGMLVIARNLIFQWRKTYTEQIGAGARTYPLPH